MAEIDSELLAGLVAYDRGKLIDPELSAKVFNSGLVSVTGGMTDAGKLALLGWYKRQMSTSLGHLRKLIPGGTADDARAALEFLYMMRPEERPTRRKRKT